MTHPDDETSEHTAVQPESPPVDEMVAGTTAPDADSTMSATESMATEQESAPEPPPAPVEPEPALAEPEPDLPPAEPEVAAVDTAPEPMTFQPEPVEPPPPEPVVMPTESTGFETAEPVAPSNQAPPVAPVAPPPEPVAPQARVDDSPTTETVIPAIAAAAAVQPSQPWQQPPQQWQQPPQQAGQWQQPQQYPQQAGQYPPTQPGYPPQQGYPQQPYPQPGYPAQTGYPPQGYPQQGYPPGYAQAGYYQQAPAYGTVALVALAGLLLAVFGFVDMGGGVWLLGQGRELAQFVERTSINLFGTTLDRPTMRALLSPLPGVLIVLGLVEVLAGLFIVAHKGWARALGIILALVGLVFGVASISFSLALAPGFSVQLIGSIVALIGYAFILLMLFAGGRHFRRRNPQG